MKIVFLYTELAGYTITCLTQAVKLYPELELHVIRWPLNKEAPFDFKFGAIKDYDKSKYTSSEIINLVDDLKPDCIIASGWIDADYNVICKKYKSTIPVIVAFDNQWKGTLKQYLGAALSKWKVRDKFNGAWVPGVRQVKFARKLGFKFSEIATGFYSADTAKFYQLGNSISKKDAKQFPKRFVYVGRYLELKGVLDLWNAFIALQNETPNEWELWLAGIGDEWNNRPKHSKIKHFGFVQAEEFKELIDGTSVFVLPSHSEQWGVSLHEFVAAGYPVIVSDAVGATDAFCIDGINGFVFKNRNVTDLKEKMKKMMDMTNDEYQDMRTHSFRLSLYTSPQKWAETLMKIANGKN